ncbi:MAG: polysaccharide deacetylase family protein [Verrucomicrobia bacterium]|jgi:peptidoglycan/xylan/chitin deacetylase (PgdA/CDA1 family)|nr:polysaccharide deacetylase family protein [Verrucomicrobiota bacterium]
MLPHYYSSLEPFRDTFQTGLPILTYHKLGPRPGRVRLKGMYLSQRLFQRQLTELQEAGFQTGALDEFADRRQSAVPGRMVITFDDGFQNVLAHGLEELARCGFRAIQFLVPDLLGKTNEWEQAEGEAPERLMDAVAVRDWLAAGHEIGSHTNTHPWLTRIPLPQAHEEISASRKKLEDCFQVPVRHFCYPYGDWNDSIRALVVEAGYATACTTESGMNLPGHDSHGLKRFTARYPSRNLKAFWQRLSSE